VPPPSFARPFTLRVLEAFHDLFSASAGNQRNSDNVEIAW